MVLGKTPDEFIPLTPLSFQILAVLSEGDNHGYGLIKELESRLESFDTASGPVYLALRRMAAEGLIQEVDPPAGVDARRKHYRISRLGRLVLAADAQRMGSLLDLVRAHRS